MVTIKEMCVVEKVPRSGCFSYVQSIPPKILDWISDSDNIIFKNSGNMPILNIGPMFVTVVTPIMAGYDVNKNSENHEIPLFVPSLAVKQDDGKWNLYTDCMIIFEVKYDKDDDGFVTRSFNMKITSKSNSIKTYFSRFEVFFLAFDV